MAVSVILELGKLEGGGARSRGPVPRRVRLLVVAAMVSAVALLSSVYLLQTPREEQLRSVEPILPKPALSPRLRLTFPGRSLYAEIGHYGNELEAYAALGELRRRQAKDKFLVTVSRTGHGAVLRTELPENLLAAIATVERLRADQVVSSSDWAVAEPGAMRRWWDESQLFEQTYSEVLQAANVNSRPPISAVADMVRISSFFSIPLRVFLPNNMAPAQERQPQWRTHAEPSDVVLARSHGRVLTMANNSVEWGETRAALQQAHGLYLSNAGGYAQLPVRFHPPVQFQDEVPPAVLFTYAGLLLKDLANRSPAEAPAGHLLSIAPDDPNVRRKLGVRRATLHASRALTHALRVNRQILLDLAAGNRSYP